MSAVFVDWQRVSVINTTAEWLQSNPGQIRVKWDAVKRILCTENACFGDYTPDQLRGVWSRRNDRFMQGVLSASAFAAMSDPRTAAEQANQRSREDSDPIDTDADEEDARSGGEDEQRRAAVAAAHQESAPDQDYPSESASDSALGFSSSSSSDAAASRADTALRDGDDASATGPAPEETPPVMQPALRETATFHDSALLSSSRLELLLDAQQRLLHVERQQLPQQTRARRCRVCLAPGHYASTCPLASHAVEAVEPVLCQATQQAQSADSSVIGASSSMPLDVSPVEQPPEFDDDDDDQDVLADPVSVAEAVASGSRPTAAYIRTCAIAYHNAATLEQSQGLLIDHLAKFTFTDQEIDALFSLGIDNALALPLLGRDRFKALVASTKISAFKIELLMQFRDIMQRTRNMIRRGKRQAQDVDSRASKRARPLSGGD